MRERIRKAWEFLNSAQPIAAAQDALADLTDGPIDLPPPTILINIGTDDTARGDSAGRRGLGRNIAKKLGTKSLYADEKTLSALYPEMEDQPYDNKLEQFLLDNGAPDIVLGFSCANVLERIGRPSEDVTSFSSYNESLSSQLLDENQLVAHHLTTEMLKEAGAEFDQQHPTIKKPLIAIFIADQGDHEIKDFSKKLTAISSHYPEATIYICGCRRNDIGQQLKTKRLLTEEIEAQNLSDKVDVINWEFSRTGYNPYKGLIARADHFIVWGNSQSLMSEPLFAGKTVHLHRSHIKSGALIEQGCVARFNDCAHDRPFMTKHFEPINLTDRLADKMIEKATTDRESSVRSFRRNLRKQSIPQSWQQYLVRVRFRPECVEDIPAPFMQDTKFVSQLLQTNTMAARFLDESILQNVEIATKLMEIRPLYFKNLPENMRDNEEVVLACADDLYDVLPHMSERLRTSKSLAAKILAHSPSAFRHMHEDIRGDQNIVRRVVKDNPDESTEILYECPKYLLEDGDFLAEMMDISVSAYHAFSSDLRSNLALARRVMKAEPHSFFRLPARVKADPECAMLAIMNDQDEINEISSLLQEDLDFVIRVIRAKGEHLFIPRIVMDHFSTDPDKMTAIVCENLKYFKQAHPDLLDDPAYVTMGLQYNVPLILQYCGENICKNKSLVMDAVTADSDNAAYIHSQLYNDEDFVRDLMQIAEPHYIFRNASRRIHNMADIATHAIDSNIEALQHIGVKLLLDRDFMAAIVQKHQDEIITTLDPGRHYDRNDDLWLHIVAFGNIDFDKLPQEIKNHDDLLAKAVKLNSALKTTIAKNKDRGASADTSKNRARDSFDNVRVTEKGDVPPKKISLMKSFANAVAGIFTGSVFAKTTENENPVIPIDKNTFD